MQRFATTIIIIVLACFALTGCEAIMGGGNEAPPPPPVVAQPGQPVPPGAPQPGALPGQPAPRPAVQPGVPAPPPTVPQPLAPAVVPPPGAPAPAAQPGVPAPMPMPAAQPGVVAPAPGQPAAPVPSTGDPLLDKVNSKKAEIAAAFIPTSAVVKQTLSENGSQAYQVQLPGPPYCHTYIAAGADAVENLDISLESPTATKEAADSVEGPVATVENHCPTAPGIYKLVVTASKGTGEFAAQVFSK